jgi:hypothetical protein
MFSVNDISLVPDLRQVGLRKLICTQISILPDLADQKRLRRTTTPPSAQIPMCENSGKNCCSQKTANLPKLPESQYTAGFASDAERCRGATSSDSAH